MGKWKSIFRLRPFLKGYKHLLVLGIIGILFSSILVIPVPYVIGYILDHMKYATLYLFIGIIVCLYILDYVISVFTKLCFSKVSNLFINDLRYAVMHKVMDLPMNYLDSIEKGYIQGRIAECSSISGLFSPSIIGMFISIIGSFFAILSMFAIKANLAIVVLALSPIFFYLSKISTKGFMQHTKNMMESNVALNAECFEIMNGMENIKILNGKKKHLFQFQNKIDAFVDQSIKQNKSIILFIGNIVLTNNLGTACILFLSCIFILNGHFTIGLYTSFALYSTRVFSSAQEIATFGTTLKPIFLSIERLFELFDLKDENQTREQMLTSEIESINFDHVSFQYKDNLPLVLNQINFSIQKGEKVLLKGENGSGKTTLIKILLGLYEATDGVVTMNDFDISKINCDSLRQHIGIVSQNIFLFRGTVLDNILYGNPSGSRKEVETLITKLGLDDYICRLPKGLDTEISQNMVGLSGGQMQVIAFIRALLSQKDVIILDEPISNVDKETRELILDILSHKQFDGILIVISHQLEGMDFVNKVIELDKKKA